MFLVKEANAKDLNANKTVSESQIALTVAR